MPELQVFYYSLLGLIVGSFLNVCIHRIPRRESIVSPRSRCPHCRTPVRAWDNIPVVSYLWLRGRCRTCGGSISMQYPAVELLTAVSFWLCAVRWEFATPTFVNSLLLCILIVLIFIDFHHQILPNVVTLPGIVAGLLLSPLQDPLLLVDPLALLIASVLSRPEALAPWIGSLLGALIGGGILYVVAFVYERIRHRAGLGMGDVKMMACVGAFLGWRLALLTIFGGSLIGSLIGIFLILFRGGSMQLKLAFGTFLGAAAALCIFLGLPFLDWYTSGY